MSSPRGQVAIRGRWRTERSGPARARDRVLGGLGVALIIIVGGLAVTQLAPQETRTMSPPVQGASGPIGTRVAAPRPTPPPVVSPTRQPPGAPKPPGEIPPLRYTAQRGDTLVAIAQRFGLTVTDLANLNGILDPNTLDAGQTLILRESGAPVRPVNPARPVVGGLTVQP